MKKKILIGISVVVLFTVLTLSSSVRAASFAGHDFSEDYFAVEVDLATTDPIGDPDVIRDLVTGVEEPDSDPENDLQFYMNFMNHSGIEVAYSALEKYENSIKLEELLPTAAVDIIDLFGTAAQKAALEEEIFHLNATAPFQQLVQHFKTPWDSDAFVANNFMTLVAYSYGTGTDDLMMDSGDELYIGYTFSVQAIIDKINEILATYSSGYQIPYFDFDATFEKIDTGYKFGINYTNMFVLWQKIDVRPRVPDILKVAQLDLPAAGGIIYGQDVVAMSVLDHLAFEYIFEVEEIDLGTTPPITVNLGTITSHYHIGETNFMLTLDEEPFITSHSGNWTYDPFVADTDYVFDIPEGLQGVDLNDLGLATPDVPPLPASVTVPLPEMAFYILDDAKMRMKIVNDFGISVVTATNWFDVDVVEQTFTTHVQDPDKDIELEKDGNVFFWTSFQNKDYYYLRELNFPPYNIDPTVKRDVYVQLFDPTGWGITGVAKEYFAAEHHLAIGFTIFIASQIAPEIVYPSSGVTVVDHFLYLTFVEFPEWYGGEIYHDPAYSAVAAVAASPGDTTTDGEDDTGIGIPGFEIVSVLLAIPPLYALYRKKR
jgi:hypothetical protein